MKRKHMMMKMKTMVAENEETTKPIKKKMMKASEENNINMSVMDENNNIRQAENDGNMM